MVELVQKTCACDLEEWLEESETAYDLYQPEELDVLDMWIETKPGPSGGHRFVHPDQEPDTEYMSAYGATWDHIKSFVVFLRNCGDGFEVW